MERIKNLSRTQKVLMSIIVAMIIAFSIIYPIIMSIKGIEFRGDFLTLKEEQGNVTYTDGHTSITVYDDQSIEFKCYHRFTGDGYRDVTYGPYSWMEDYSAIPAVTEDGMLSSDDYIGVKIMVIKCISEVLSQKKAIWYTRRMVRWGMILRWF